MFKKIGVAVAAAFLCVNVLASTTMPTFTNSDSKITVAPSSHFKILLNSNPASTGYHWTVTSYPKTMIRLVKQNYIAPSKQLMGASGTEEFIFKVKPTHYAVNQVSHIILNYARPWTKVGSSGKTFVLTVTQ